MKTVSKQRHTGGFAAIEAVLILIIIVAVIGIGAYVLHQKSNSDKTLTTTSSEPVAKASAGTTESIDQLTEQDAKDEAAVDKAGDSSLQQAATSPDTSVNNVGGAYNESNF